MENNYYKKSPCNNCPYRTDAPLKLWHKSEYEKLLASENSQCGSIYLCHKKDGHVCVGWLMKQDEQNFPSIMLRISLSKNNVTREYLDSLNCNAPLYKDVRAMIKANFPNVLRKLSSLK
jgi:hypothetical protein